MSYKIIAQHEPYFLTFTTVGWIDVFTRKKHRDIFLQAVHFYQKQKGLRVHAYVIMSNHVHMICHSQQEKLSSILRDLKKFTAKKIIENICAGVEKRQDWMRMVMHYHAKTHVRNHTYQLWQHSNHAVLVSDLRMLYQRLVYIHMNPVKAFIVREPEHYMYSSAGDYIGRPGLLNVEVLDIEPLIGYVPG